MRKAIEKLIINQSINQSNNQLKTKILVYASQQKWLKLPTSTMEKGSTKFVFDLRKKSILNSTNIKSIVNRFDDEIVNIISIVLAHGRTKNLDIRYRNPVCPNVNFMNG